MRQMVDMALAIALTLTTACTYTVAQEGPPEGLERAARVQEVVEREGGWLGPALWPGFRPDTVAMMYVVPGVGKLFAHHEAAQPEGFRPYPAQAGWSWAGPERVSFSQGRIAFLTVTTDAPTVGLAIHEAFHEYQEQEARQGIAFGRRENALSVVAYPVFEGAGQADLALEGALLGRALAAAGAVRRARAAEFLAVRRARRSELDSRFVAFEEAAELNEGLAQYTLVKALDVLAARPGFPWSIEARAEVAGELDRLSSLLETGGRSVRRTFYTTGAAMGLLLDDLAPQWKDRLMAEDITLDSLLAEGLTEVSAADVEAIRSRSGASFRAAADEAVRALAVERDALRDSLLARPGVAVELRAGPRVEIDWCGFDPQNTLATEAGEVLHMRWLRLCVAGQTVAEISGGVVQVADRTGYVLVLADSARVGTANRAWRAGEDWPTGSVEALEIVTAAGELRVPVAEVRREEGHPVIVVRDTAPAWALRVPPIASLVTRAGQPTLWPGFRPDTLPTVYMVRGGGAVYVNPVDSLPAAFTPLPGTDGGWITTSPFGPLAGLRFTLTSVLPDASPASDAGLAVHETFHGYQRMVRTDDRRFGGGEDPAGIREYPAFDPVNVTLLDREGALLVRAISAESDTAAETLAREFLAVRTARRARLPDSVATYERMAELNEGLAEYVRIRALERWAAEAPAPYAAQAAVERRALMARLDTLYRVTDPQSRRIFYATGTGIGKVLDRLDPGWPARLVRHDLALEEQLARAVGGPADVEVPVRGDPTVQSFLEALRERRVVTADSLQAAEGLSVQIEWAEGAGFQICGLDPLNAAPVGDGRVLHRLVRLCHDGELLAAIGSPSVESLPGRSLMVPLGVEPTEAAVTVDDRPLADWLDNRTPSEAITVNVGGVQIDAPLRRLTYDNGRLTATLAAP